MKTLDSALQAHLDDGTTTLAWCWRIERVDGQVFGFTDHDRPLSFGGTIFEPESGFSASELRHRADLSADAHEAEGALSSDRITELDILDGRWDGASVEVWRVNWQDVSQRVLMRRGNIGQIRRGRVSFIAEVRSLAHHLSQERGRVYQGSCDAVLGDARCGVDLDDPAFSGSGVVGAVLRDRAFTALGIEAFGSGWFTHGVLQWSSGANAGRLAEVARHVTAAGSVEIVLLEAPVRPVAPGDQFVVRAGCDKRVETCAAKFGNVANFRGCPHIPGTDAVLRYAVRDGGYSGEVL